MTELLRRGGEGALDLILSLIDMWRMLSASFVAFFRSSRTGGKVVRKAVFKQVYFTGIEALSLVSWISLMIGVVIVTQAISILPKLGAENLIGKILVWVVIRELGPLLVAIIVTARSGTAIASEAGSMRMNYETMALEVMGINLDRYFVMPRVIGTTMAVFALTFYFESVSILGGYLFASLGRGLPFGVYTDSILGALEISDLIASSLKSILFGLIIGSVCCHHGLKVGRSITEIPQQTTKAVVRSLLFIFLVDGCVSAVFFL